MLRSYQGEANTKMFLAAQFAIKFGLVKVNIITIDTDVAVLAIYYRSVLKSPYSNT